MPLEQISETEYFYAGYIENVGYNTLDSLRIHAEVSSVDLCQSYGLSLVSSDKDSIYVNDGFTPTEIGTYTADIVGKDDNGYVLTEHYDVRLLYLIIFMLGTMEIMLLILEDMV